MHGPQKVKFDLMAGTSTGVLCKKDHHHLHHLPPWIRSFDLFRHRRIDIVSWGRPTISSSSRFVVEGVFRQSGVVHSFKMVDPGLFVFESHVLYSRDL